MAGLESLPLELFSEITSALPYSAVASLCLTSRTLYIKANPLLWRHLQFGPRIPDDFDDPSVLRIRSAQFSPYPRSWTIKTNRGEPENNDARWMDVSGILKFYTAARKNWIRDETFKLVRSIELQDGVLGGCLEPFDNVGWWRNGEFHAVFKEIVALGNFGEVTSINIVYVKPPDRRRDLSVTELNAVRKAQEFCQTLGNFAATRPSVRVKISTTQFSLVSALFYDVPPAANITSLRTTLSRHPDMVEKFSLEVLPNLQSNLQELVILVPHDCRTLRSLGTSPFDAYSGMWLHYLDQTFDDETEFARYSFPALRSVEYTAELFGFIWAPEGIKRLCVRHSTVPEVRWWKELATKEMKGLETLEVWVDCEIVGRKHTSAGDIHRKNEANYWSPWTEVSFKGLKSLVIASNSSCFRLCHPPLELVNGSTRPGDDNVTGIPIDIIHAIVTANPGLQHVFVECIDSQALETLLSRGKVRSLTIQNRWGIDLQRHYCLPFDAESLTMFRNCKDLEWLHLCVRDSYDVDHGIPRRLVELLAVYCRKLLSFVMEDRRLDGTAFVVDERFQVEDTGVSGARGETRDLGRWIKPMRPESGECLRRLDCGFFVFELEGFRKYWSI